MNAETQKPFACKVKDCGMSFTNEDHLTVHEKKHDMILNLGITNKAAGAFIADQTPTPTRLIKNCEEVGLFDDLKHVNPFDETFRRAVEANADTPSIENVNESEDSLHTPQVFPQFDANTEATISPKCDTHLNEFKVEKQRLILPDNIEVKKKKPPRQNKQSRKCSNTNSKPMNILPTPNPLKSYIVPATINLVPATQIIALSIPTASFMQRPLLLPKIPITDTVTAQTQPELSVKDKLKAHLNSPKVTSPTISSTSSSMPSDRARKRDSSAKNSQNGKRDCMERRRAAALRYRRKIKKEQTDLKKKNSELVTENNQLRVLVKELKELLCAHQNCNVTISRGIRSSGAAQDVQSLMPTIQIPIATSIKLIAQDVFDNNIGTIIKIPVPDIE